MCHWSRGGIKGKRINITIESTLFIKEVSRIISSSGSRVSGFYDNLIYVPSYTVALNN